MSAEPFNWQAPNYLPVFQERAARLAKLRADPSMLAAVRLYYRDHLDDFINDWGVTVDPRVAASGRSPIMPLLLWPKQREFVRWIIEGWRLGKPGTVVKSRDVGISWLAMATSVGMSVFFENVSIGFGSAKEEKVDRSGDPDCLFYKGRMFLQYLPEEFRGGFTLKDNSAHMRLSFPHTGSSITGEAGDNIGRGGRKSIYFVDESAHIPRPKLIDASLSANTECRVDMSSVNGTANSFYERAHNPDIRRFDFALEDDPRRTPEYWENKRATTDPAVFAAEYGRDFTASIDGVVIPSAHVSAAIDAHKVLGLAAPTGPKRGAFDVADTGADRNAFGVCQSFLVSHVESWKGSLEFDISHSTDKCFALSDMHGVSSFVYDGDGVGANVRGPARVANERRAAAKAARLSVDMFRGSAGVFEPEKIVEGTERKAEDFFENLKAQAWWLLRSRFNYTYHIVQAYKRGERPAVDVSKVISIASEIPERAKLQNELSQAIWQTSKTGKIMVDKCPPGTTREAKAAISSPNLADVVMMLYAPRKLALSIHPSLLQSVSPQHASFVR